MASKKNKEVPWYDPDGVTKFGGRKRTASLGLADVRQTHDPPTIHLDGDGVKDVVQVSLRPGGPPEMVILALQLWAKGITFNERDGYVVDWGSALSPTASRQALEAVVKKSPLGRDEEKKMVSELLDLHAFSGARLVVWIGLKKDSGVITGQAYRSGFGLESTRVTVEKYNHQMARQHWFRAAINYLSRMIGCDWFPVPKMVVPNTDPWNQKETRPIVERRILGQMQTWANTYFEAWLKNDTGLRERLLAAGIKLPKPGPTTPVPSLSQGERRILNERVFGSE